MKYLFFLLGLVFFSCSPDSTDSGTTPKSVLRTRANADSLYYSIVSLYDTREQLDVVYALSPNDKMLLWQTKLDDFKSNNTLTTTQLDFINSFQTEINDEELFKENSLKRNNFKSNRKDYYMTKSKELFGENEGWYLLTQVENVNHRKAHLQLTNPKTFIDPIYDCDCNLNDDCKRITGIGLDGFQWENGECKNNTCYAGGFWWWDDENKICVY